MTRSELQVLSQAHAVALMAIVSRETRIVPMAAAFTLRQAAREDMPVFVPAADLFVNALRDSHGVLDHVCHAGYVLRQSVSQLMAFVPVDADRVDIHG